MRMMPRWLLLMLLMLLMLLLTEDLVLPMVNIPKPMADGASAPTLPHIFGSRWMQLCTSTSSAHAARDEHSEADGGAALAPRSVGLPLTAAHLRLAVDAARPGAAL